MRIGTGYDVHRLVEERALILGGVLIYFINQIGTTFGVHIGLNVITSIFIGILFSRVCLSLVNFMAHFISYTVTEILL